MYCFGTCLGTISRTTHSKQDYVKFVGRHQNVYTVLNCTPVCRLRAVPLLQEDLRHNGGEAAQGRQDGPPRGEVDPARLSRGHPHHLGQVQHQGRHSDGRASQPGQVRDAYFRVIARVTTCDAAAIHILVFHLAQCLNFQFPSIETHSIYCTHRTGWPYRYCTS